MRSPRLIAALFAVLLFCCAAPLARAGGMSEAQYAEFKTRIGDLLDARRYAAADSLLKPWWARVVPDSAKHPGPAGRIIQWQARTYSDSWYDSARLPGSWTPAQSYDWLVVSSRLLRRAYGDDSAYEHQESYLKVVFGFFGITNVRIVRAEGLAMGEAARAQALEKAGGQVRALFAEAANASPVAVAA